MATDDFKRKLTAILSADVVGYSRLMGEDEEETVLTLNKYKELIFNLVDQNNGRVIDSPGDNILTEFACVVDAVRCGVHIQEGLKEHNEELPSNRKMELRIGINICDIIQDGDRIYGDGVNIAARIESLADPGGFCITGLVYAQVKNKLDLEYEFIGKQKVKNISEPVPVYKVKLLTETTINIVDSLKVKLFGKDKESLVKTYTENIEAYEAYIKGRYYYLNFMEDAMEKALHYYNRAIILDPGYAFAYSAIAECCQIHPIF